MATIAKENFNPNIEGQKIVSGIAMAIVLVSFSMLFASLFLGYAVYRFQNPVWPPMGMQKVPLALPTLSTIIIALSSVFFIYFQKSYETFSKGKMKLGLYLTLLFGLGFVGAQFLLWDKMESVGLYVEAGVFPSLLYAFTWIHIAHIALGFVFLLALIPTLYSEGPSFKLDNRITNVGKFWHFLGLIWFLIYLVLFVF